MQNLSSKTDFKPAPDMEAMATAQSIRSQLLDWRRRLEAGLAQRGAGAPHLSHLLYEVNLTLTRLDKGSYGACEECRATLKDEGLAPDALERYRLARLTPDQLDALQRDLDLAWQIQGGLLPNRNLSSCSWEVGYHYEAAGPVSGDFCDMVRLDGGDLFFLLGDVSGKGIAASVLMAHLHAIFRSLVTLGLPLGQLVERVNRVFVEFTMSTHFATLVCGRVDRFGLMEICNAGHCPPLLVQAGEVTSIEATGLPVGMFCCGRYAVRKVQLARNDRLFLYTDGLSEARDAAGVEYGTDKLARLVREQHALSSQALIGACLEDLAAFQKGTQKTDDLTLMAIRRNR
jgi:sigma-B regulation protein RsbU (phosphoserine phosphatase)